MKLDKLEDRKEIWIYNSNVGDIEIVIMNVDNLKKAREVLRDFINEIKSAKVVNIY